MKLCERCGGTGVVVFQLGWMAHSSAPCPDCSIKTFVKVTELAVDKDRDWANPWPWGENIFPAESFQPYGWLKKGKYTFTVQFVPDEETKP